MRRWAVRGVGAILVLIAIAFVAQRLFGDRVAEPRVMVPRPAATIGSGSEAIAVTAGGAVVRWFPLDDEPDLPQLPLTEVPKGGHLRGPALQQARVLGGAPVALQPYLASSRYGESGVDVETTSGIELRFGDATQLEKKWKAVAAVLADPSIEVLDYVNVAAPSHPSIGGSGHTLPPAP